MGEFDKILKENIEAVFLPLVEKMLGLSIKETFEVKDKVQTTIEREPDFFKESHRPERKRIDITVGVSDYERPENDL